MGKITNSFKKIIAGAVIVLVDVVGLFAVQALTAGTGLEAMVTSLEFRGVVLAASWQIWEQLVRPEFEDYSTASSGGNGWNFIG